jgi:hypothetical protein
VRRRIILFALVLAASAHAGNSKPNRYVSVGDVVAMKQLSETSPDTFAKAASLLREIDCRPARGAAEWAKAKFGADNLVHSATMTLSQPPKRSISFTIGNTGFAGTYELGQWGRCGS